MSEITVEVEAREEGGKAATRRLRREGKIPAVLYGSKKEAVPLAVDPRALELVLQGELGMNTLFHLSLAGQNLRRMVMIKDYQVNPLNDRIIHADFVRVEQDRKLQLRVPVRLDGTPEGVKNEGGLMDFVHREVHIECLPKNIPEFLRVDVSPLRIGQTVTVADLEIPEGVEPQDPAEMVLATVSAPRKIEEAAEVPAEEAAEAASEEAASEEAAEAKPEE